MLTIHEFDHNNNFRELKNCPGLFHEALKYVLKGETHFHVLDEESEGFDLIYVENDRKAKADPTFPNSEFFKGELIFPPYFTYDETDTDRISMNILEGFEEIFFEDANEYTITIAGMVLSHSSLRVTFRNRKALYFPWIRNRIRISPEPETSQVLYVQKDYYPVYVTKDRFCSLGLFHSLFLLQWLTDLPREKIRYLELTIRKTEGIGSVLSTYIKTRKAFDRLGIRTYIAPGCTRYSDRLLNRYFLVDSAPADADPSNTIYAKCFNCFVLNHFIQRNEAVLDPGIFQSAFLHEMEEYAKEVIGDRKVLGVLLRGTDIVVANYADAYRPADIDDCIRIISDRMKQYGYDRIFLATEDSYFLERMLAAFPHKVVIVSQERHQVSDFNNVHFISDLEKQKHSGKAYLDYVEDTTVNYMYAMYLLSRCESLIANCMCNGVNLAVSLNQGKYARKEIISEMI